MRNSHGPVSPPALYIINCAFHNSLILVGLNVRKFPETNLNVEIFCLHHFPFYILFRSLSIISGIDFEFLVQPG